MDNKQIVPFERGSFLQHTAEVAQLVGADFSSSMMEKVFNVLESGLEPEHAPLGWKITPVAKPRAYFNICNHNAVDLLTVLRAGDLVPSKCFEDGQTQDVYMLVEDEMVDGADFNTNSGLCKVWVYTHMAPLEKLYENKYLPESVRRFEPFFRKHGLDTYFFLASDFEKNSMNVYFPWFPEQRTAQWVEGFAQTISGCPLSAAALQGILASSEYTIGLGVTFNWEDELPQRACFYNACPNEELPALSKETLVLRERLRGALPALINDPTYFYNWSIGRAGEFIKIEKDYSGDFWQHVQTAYGLNPEATHLMLDQ